MKVSYVMCTDCECREVNEVKRGLDNEGNVTNGKERETNEGRQPRLVNLCRHLHISVMALHIKSQGKERMIKLEVQSSKKGQGRESLQYPLVYYFIHAVLVIIVINAITHTDYTQYTYKCI